MSAPPDLRGRRFGRLTVTGPANESSYGNRRWTCLCECGAVTSKTTAVLLRGDAKSCGCLHRDIAAGVGRRHARVGTTVSRLLDEDWDE